MTEVFTGSTDTGVAENIAPLGGEVTANSGLASSHSDSWITYGDFVLTKDQPLYALSTALTVPTPEPATITLLGSAFVARWFSFAETAKDGEADCLRFAYTRQIKSRSIWTAFFVGEADRPRRLGRAKRTTKVLLSGVRNSGNRRSRFRRRLGAAWLLRRCWERIPLAHSRQRILVIEPK